MVEQLAQLVTDLGSVNPGEEHGVDIGTVIALWVRALRRKSRESQVRQVVSADSDIDMLWIVGMNLGCHGDLVVISLSRLGGVLAHDVDAGWAVLEQMPAVLLRVDGFTDGVVPGRPDLLILVASKSESFMWTSRTTTLRAKRKT